VETAPTPGGGTLPQPQGFAPYFERTVGATEMVPGVYQPERPFGPILMFETNLGGGVGYTDGSQRVNARMPFHIVPNMMLMLGDVSGGVTWDGKPYVSGGGIYRYFDPTRNRVFGMNMFFDYDEGLGFGNQTRTTVGVESLGQYVDFRANAYVMVGDDTTLLSTTLLPNIALAGNNVFRQHEEVRANAYSGGDFELGGPLPLLGRYGMNMYPGMYYLTNDSGHDALGFQVRWEALVTQNLTVNTTLAHDGTFDTNAFVGIQYEIPNYRHHRTFRPRMTRERLMDPVVRSNRIQQRIDTIVKNDAIINAQSGNPWSIVYVDPNLGVPGSGTLESPYNSMQLAKFNNNAGVDIIRIAPRLDDSGTNLTLNGGMSLFDDQVLVSSLMPFQLEPGAVIPADVNPNPPLAPLLSDPVHGGWRKCGSSGEQQSDSGTPNRWSQCGGYCVWKRCLQCAPDHRGDTGRQRIHPLRRRSKAVQRFRSHLDYRQPVRWSPRCLTGRSGPLNRGWNECKPAGGRQYRQRQQWCWPEDYSFGWFASECGQSGRNRSDRNRK
jgi:hypothetical protein